MRKNRFKKYVKDGFIAVFGFIFMILFLVAYLFFGLATLYVMYHLIFAYTSFVNIVVAMFPVINLIYYFFYIDTTYLQYFLIWIGFVILGVIGVGIMSWVENKSYKG